MSNSHDRIFHHVTGEATTLGQCLKKHFRLEEPRIHELLALGAIYSNKKRVMDDRALAKGTYLRLHLQPRRFPVESVDWKSTLVHENPHFLVVNKPAGIPVHASVDNALDNVLHQLRVVTKHHLLVTQRLDVPVAGLMVLAKTPDFQRRFNQWLVDRKVGKVYRALVESAPPLGLHVHYMEPSERSPKRVSVEAFPSWVRCELSVLGVTELSEKRFEVEIALHTGRTHQIRAQLAALGSPVLGDKMYRSRAPYPQTSPSGESIALFSTSIAWPNPGAKPFEFRVQPVWPVNSRYTKAAIPAVESPFSK